MEPPPRKRQVGSLSRTTQRIVFWLLAGPVIVLLLPFVVDTWQQSRKQAVLAAALEALPELRHPLGNYRANVAGKRIPFGKGNFLPWDTYDAKAFFQIAGSTIEFRERIETV